MKARRRPIALCALVAVSTASGTVGCRGAAAVFLDLPEERSESVAPNPTATSQSARTLAVRIPQDTLRPPIEVLTLDSALALLPRDAVGNVDWVTALRSGVIDPLRSLPGAAPRPDMSGFAFDFRIKGPNPMFDAVFSHSSHVEWLACESCHPTIFPYQGAEITMAAINQGEYCGACHGKVAFPVATGCTRCHESLNMPPTGQAAEALGDLVFERRRDSTDQQVFGASQFPPARFSHAVHRVRYRCMACHPEPFEARAGANAITMAEVSARRACGVCHDGGTAFSGLRGCNRCHVAASSPRDSMP